MSMGVSGSSFNEVTLVLAVVVVLIAMCDSIEGVRGGSNIGAKSSSKG